MSLRTSEPAGDIANRQNPVRPLNQARGHPSSTAVGDALMSMQSSPQQARQRCEYLCVVVPFGCLAKRIAKLAINWRFGNSSVQQFTGGQAGQKLSCIGSQPHTYVANRIDRNRRQMLVRSADQGLPTFAKTIDQIRVSVRSNHLPDRLG